MRLHMMCPDARCRPGALSKGITIEFARDDCQHTEIDLVRLKPGPRDGRRRRTCISKENTAARMYTEAEMRKEDRIRQQRDREQQSRPQSSTQPKDQEKMRGRAESEQPSKPPRQSGKLPLPD